MSRAKLFNMIKSRGEKPVGRNSFDLTNRHVYSQKAAKITPIKALHTYPDDYFEVNVEDFSQNKVPMNHYSFLTGKKELLAYFVPYNTIWHNFNQYQATREDPESTLLYDKGISFEPRLRLKDLYSAAFYFAAGYVFFTNGIILHDLNRNRSANTDTTVRNIPEFLEYAKTSGTGHYYQKMYDRSFADAKTRLFTVGCPFLSSMFDCFEVAHGGQSSTFTMFESITNLHQNFIWCDFIQKLDMLGYGNIYPIIHDFVVYMQERFDSLIYNNENSEYYKVVENGVTTYHCSVRDPLDNQTYDLSKIDFFDPESSALYYPQLFSWRGFYNSLMEISVIDYNTQNPKDEYVNAYALYAYNKCFYDYMRNVYYDTNYSPYNYNCDFISGNSLAGSIIEQAFIPCRWYHLECHQWKKDMFTGILPDNQLGQVSELILNTMPNSEIVETRDTIGYPERSTSDFASVAVQSNEDLTENPVWTNTSDNILRAETMTGGSDVQIQQKHWHGINATDLRGTATLNVLALKRAEAIQQYRQDLMRAGNRTQDIFQQVYGSTPKSELDESPYFIEVASQDINVNPIIATSQTGDGQNQSLGDIAARCTISGQNLNFKFSTKDFGVVLIMSYIIPDSFYNSYRLDPLVTHLDQESHGLPYFQNLGLQPIIGEFLNNMKGSSIRNRTLGYAPPYIERKTDIDLVHGDFVDSFYAPEDQNFNDLDYQGEMSHWVVARTDMQQEQTVSLRNFYIDPRILDNIFSFSAGSDYSTDHFFSYCSIKVNAVRAFSELGLPRF